MNRKFKLLLALVLLFSLSNNSRAQEVNGGMFPNTIKEIRLHAPGIVSFGMLKPLNEQDLIGAKIGGGYFFPALIGGLYLEYRHYFRPMNVLDHTSKGSFLYTVKPYIVGLKIYDADLDIAAINAGISGGVGYEWKFKSGLFLRPSAELNIPATAFGHGMKGVWPMSLSQSFLSTLAVGWKW